MSTNFVCSSFFSLTHTRQAIYYPLYRHPTLNISFVPVIDEDQKITDFSEFMSFEGIDVHHLNVSIPAKLGDIFFVGFFDLNDKFHFGVPAVLSGKLDILREKDLLPSLVDLQIGRMLGRKGGLRTSNWKAVSDKYIKSSMARKVFLTTELSILQKTSAIWKKIRAEKKDLRSTFSDEEFFIRMTSEEIFIWLSKNVDDGRWTLGWLHLRGKVGGNDDRIWSLGLDYLIKKQSVEAKISAIHQAVIRSLLEGVRDYQTIPFDFLEFIRDLIVENQDFVERNILSDDEFLWMLRLCTELDKSKFDQENLLLLTSVVCDSKLPYSRAAIVYTLIMKISSRNNDLTIPAELVEHVKKSIYFEGFSFIDENKFLANKFRKYIGKNVRN